MDHQKIKADVDQLPPLNAGPMRILCVTEELPSFQQAGHGVWLDSVLTCLNNLGHEIICTLTTRKVGFFAKDARALPYRIHAKGVVRIGGLYVTVESNHASVQQPMVDISTAPKMGSVAHLVYA